METLIYLILGIIQGITEPLPISSSGHLLIFEKLLNVTTTGISFEAFVNFGSTIAIIYYFRAKIWKLILEGLAYLYSTFKVLINKKERNNEYLKYKRFQNKYFETFDYILKVIIATIPLVIIGIILLLVGFDGIENIKVVGVALLVTAIALFLVSKSNGKKAVKDLTYIDCIIIGLFQAIALMPGISRSGMSLVGSLFIGLKSEEAFEFVFMLYLPASVGAMLISIIQIASDKEILKLLPNYIVALLAAGIFTYIGLKLLKNLVLSHKLAYFSIYCTVVGLLTIVFL